MNNENLYFAKKNYFETQENKNGNGHGKCHCKFLDRISRLLGK